MFKVICNFCNISFFLSNFDIDCFLFGQPMMFPAEIKDGLITVGAPLGSGTFGDVFKAKMKDGRDVAIKFESAGAKIDYLTGEIAIYSKLKGKPGFPKRVASGHTKTHRFIVMELLGPSLINLLKKHEQCFSLTTVKKIGVEILDRLEILHGENIVHSDLKPDNIMVSLNDQSSLILADFGLAVEITNDLQKPYLTNSMRGSLKYMAIGVFEGKISFRNDVESLAYMLIVLIGQGLPWDNPVSENDKNQTRLAIYRKVYKMKMDFLKNPPSLPAPLRKFLAATNSLDHLQRPNYAELRQYLA